MLHKVTAQIDTMSRPAYLILKLAFAATYLCLVCALVWAVRIYLAGGALPMSAYRAVDGFVRLPQAVLLIGILASAVTEELHLTGRL